MVKSTLIQALLVLRQSYQKGLFYSNEKFLSFDGNLASIGSYRDAIYAEFEKETDFIEIKICFSNIKINCKTEAYYKNESVGSEVLLNNTNFTSDVFKEALFSKNKFQFIKAERIGPRDLLNTNNRNVLNKDFGSDGAYAMHFFLEKATKFEIPIPALKHSSEDNLLLELQMNAWLNEISPNIRIKSELVFDKITPKFSYHSNGIPRNAFLAKNIGFGVSYIFSVVLAILTAEPDDLIIIENPEAHLHPRGQSNLAQLMAIAAQNGVQIFVETHSDHIINGARIGVKKGLSNDDVKIFYFTRNSNDFYATVYDVPILPDGKLSVKNLIENDVTGFFDQLDIDFSIILGI
jgi:predicted ATPase